MSGIFRRQTFAFWLTLLLALFLGVLLILIGIGLFLGVFISDSPHEGLLLLIFCSTLLVPVLLGLLVRGVHRKNRIALVLAAVLFSGISDYLVIVFNNFHTPHFISLDVESAIRLGIALATTFCISSVYIRELRNNWRQ